MIEWSHFPRSRPPYPLTPGVVGAFTAVESIIGSPDNTLKSNAVLSAVRPHLEAIGFVVEGSGEDKDKLQLPVLYGSEGAATKQYKVDAFHADHGFVLEVEAGAAGANNRALLDLIKGCLIPGVEHIGIAVRKVYGGGGSNTYDYKHFVRFVDSIYASDRLVLPLKTVTVIGY